MTEKSKDLIVVAGHISLDITPKLNILGSESFKNAFSPGKLVDVDGVELATGGVVSNTGISLNILGMNTKLMGKIGDDGFGKIVIGILQKYNLDKSMVVDNDVRTSYTVVLVAKGVDRIFLHDPGANHSFGIANVDFSEVKEASLFHFGYPNIMKKMYENDAIETIKLFKKVKNLGVMTSLDMCMPDINSFAGKVDWLKIFENLLPYVDIFAPSIEELLWMIDKEAYTNFNQKANGKDMIDVLDVETIKKAGEKLLSFGAKIILIKCGKMGAYLLTCSTEMMNVNNDGFLLDVDLWSNREIFKEPSEVSKILSTTGAGDALIAGFLAAVVKGFDPESSMAIANKNAGNCIQTYDTLSGIKSLDETILMDQKTIKNASLKIDKKTWRYNQQNECWYGMNDKKENE